MQYATNRIEISHGIACEQDARAAHHRRKVLQAIADRDPADELQARLLIMEQSLICMTHFLKILERDLQDALSTQPCRTQKHFEDRRKAPRSETIAEASDRFALQATDAVMRADEVGVLESVAKAMQLLSRH